MKRIRLHNALPPCERFVFTLGDAAPPVNPLSDPEFIQVILARMFSPLSARIMRLVCIEPLTFVQLQERLGDDAEKTKLRIILAHLRQCGILDATAGRYHPTDDNARLIVQLATALHPEPPVVTQRELAYA